jgi:7-cyano-7-deazaguanine reductase
MIQDSPLGQKTEYIETYSPHLLYPIPRKMARDRLGFKDELPFRGVDFWNGNEFSFLNMKGKPIVLIPQFIFPCSSPNIIESKSFKLYLNSFSQSKFESLETVQNVITEDLSKAAQATISVQLTPLPQASQETEEFQGICLDDLDIQTDVYHVDKSFLTASSHQVHEVLYSNILKSKCLATGQPDWGSIQIEYFGSKIDHEGLLKYIISYQKHYGFAEHCAELFFYDIWTQCRPERLSVYIRYTKRGGLDINPFRSNFMDSAPNFRLLRQ